MGYVYLALAIVGELIGTNLLKASSGFTLLWPSLGALIAYGTCFYFLGVCMKTVNLNIAYALWAGIGVVLSTLVAVLFWKEPVNLANVIGIGFILVGVVILNLFGANG
ncbi:multidrug resistance protein [Pediococcus damnosus]|uniref:DMT family transporter n=1 Tax=Pediococcus damnosus TaxID=51663 RepID=UPI00114369D2|nr:multidrug efflux SMR transporter [Pediococcus damnosus]GEA94014.1 multidrug resistance protein [Pediococcus damnosus]